MVEEQKQIDEIKSLCQSAGEARAVVDGVMKYLQENRGDYHWVGVYILKGSELHLGPYYGPETDHLIIPVGRGVCGTAVATNQNQVIEDVRALDNYLACNLETRSEIVVLIRDPDGSGRVVGQIDIDGTKVGSLNGEEPFLAQVAGLIAPAVKTLQLN